MPVKGFKWDRDLIRYISDKGGTARFMRGQFSCYNP